MIVEVSARKVTVPATCVCCHGHAEGDFSASYTRTSGKRVIRQQTRSWAFPCCHRCLAHVRMWNSAGTIALIVVVVAAIIGVIVGTSSAGAGAGLFALSLPLALVLASRRRRDARAACGQECAAVGPPVSYLGWDGSLQRFDFASHAYAADFAERNGRALVNVHSELRRALDSNRGPAVQVVTRPAPAAPPAVAAAPVRPAPPSEHDRALAWIAKIEAYKGPVARANALRRALDELRDPEARRAVTVAAAKIEVSAVLDKVDELAAPAAKRRHLEKAIANLRADDIPDELQAEEIRELQARLDAL